MRKSLPYILAIIMVTCILVVARFIIINQREINEARNNAQRAIEQERDRQLQRAAELRVIAQ